VPGIWILTSPNQIPKILECGASIPAKLRSLMEDNDITDEDKRKIGIEYAVTQIRELVANKTPGIHLYTLNKAENVSKVLDGLV